MERKSDDFREEAGERKAQVDTTRKVLLEIKDILMGLAFPVIVMLVVSSTILIYSSYTEDLAVSLIACIGGEILIVGSLIIFGRANGSAAYQKTALNTQKRNLGSTDEKVLYKTGEYAVWKSVVIGAVLCVPFIIFQSIQLGAPNKFCEFCLQYICGWAYFPFSYLGKEYQALNYIWITVPIAAHTLGYYLGKLKAMKISFEDEKKSKGKRRGK